MARKFTFHGVEYRYLRSRTKDYGYCHPPDQHKKKRIIGISNQVKGKKELETNIHEFLHACGWSVMSEEWVLQSAKDITQALWELGYRKDETKAREEGSE